MVGKQYEKSRYKRLKFTQRGAGSNSDLPPPPPASLTAPPSPSPPLTGSSAASSQMPPTNAVETSLGSISSAPVLPAWARFRRPDLDPHPATTSTPAATATDSQVENEPYGQVLYSARTGRSEEEERKNPSQCNVRGVNNGKLLKKQVKRNGRIAFVWDPVRNVPSAFSGEFVRYMGSCIRDKVSMAADTWYDVDHLSLSRLIVALSVFFETEDHPELNYWVNSRAYHIYKDWKCDLHRHFEKHNHKGRDGTPSELRYRESEWIWLCNHFKTL